jgi:flavorubredoxin
VDEEIDLGGRTITFVEAVIRDLETSLWMFDDVSRTLFPGDGFAYMHHHRASECGLFAEEIDHLPIAEFTAIFAEYALYWTRFTPIEDHLARLDRVLAETGAQVIAPGHGCPIRDVDRTLGLVKDGMSLGAKSGLA